MSNGCSAWLYSCWLKGFAHILFMELWDFPAFSGLVKNLNCIATFLVLPLTMIWFMNFWPNFLRRSLSCWLQVADIWVIALHFYDNVIILQSPPSEYYKIIFSPSCLPKWVIPLNWSQFEVESNGIVCHDFELSESAFIPFLEILHACNLEK